MSTSSKNTTTNGTNPTDPESVEPSAPEAPQPVESASTGTADDAESEATGREAAKYRRRLRETESERDAVAATLAASQVALIDVLAERSQVRPAALWASGAVLEDLLDDETATVDPAKVSAACETAAIELGLSRNPRPDRSQGAGIAPRPSGPAAFTEALRF